MSNKASHQVHELILALTPAEKRYFKLFAERHSGSGKNNYLLLFEAMEKQDEYNEEAILKRFENASFVKHFSIAKNRLYHQILKSLDAFHAESSAEAEVSNYLHYVEILFHKNLHKQCSRLLSTAEKLAEKHGNHIAMLRVLKWQKRLIESKSHETEESEIIRKLEFTLTHIKNENRLWKLKSRVFSTLFKSGPIRDNQNALEAEKLLKELSKMKGRAQDFESEYLVHHIRSAVYFSLSDYEKCKSELLRNLRLIEKNLELVKDEPLHYHSVLINLIYVSAKLNDFQAVNSFLTESRALPETLKLSPSPYIEFRLFTDTYGLELAICNLTGDTARGKELVQTIPDQLNEWDYRLSDVKRAAFLHGLAVMHFTMGDYSGALRWNNELLNSVKMENAEDLVLFSHMFHAILHLELGHLDLLVSIEKSLKRYLETRDKRYRFETHFLRLLKCIRVSKGAEMIRQCIQNFHDEILPMEHESYEKVAFEYFDFTAWAEAKANGTPFREKVSERSAFRNVL